MPSSAGADRNLAQVLRTLRERRGRTQESLAHDAGMSVAAYRRVERGLTNPGWQSVMSILSALDVSLHDLADELDNLKK
jgi:transcriptional regulator with XRE-family HTH domain